MKAFVIAGTQSGSGKTSVALGVCAALRARGLRVQTFKCGPDYLDPTYLALASGRPCYNLDPWLGGEDYVRSLFIRACAGNASEPAADVALVEGVMGLYDGVAPESNAGSTAQIARLLDLPVLLLASCASCARTFAAVALGLTTFPDAPEFLALAANMSGSDAHTQTIARALSSMEGLPPFAGALQKGALPELKSRHLGLLDAQNDPNAPEVIAQLGQAVETALDLELSLSRAREVNAPDLAQAVRVAHDFAKPASRLRLAVARDRAFSFYYPDNLRALAEAECEIVEFSPLDDEALPPDCAGVYIGGGYPECYARELAQNTLMRDAIANYAAAGGLLYAECGGLMYLSRSLRTLEDETFSLCGVFPVSVRMLPRRQTLGYMEAELLRDTLWGAAGARLRGHEYHYSRIESEIAADWECAYLLRRGRAPSDEARPEGYTRGRVLLSYLHLHFAANPSALASFMQRLARH